LLLKVAGFEPDPTGGVYPILDIREELQNRLADWLMALPQPAGTLQSLPS
jgi:hypothetical protein